MVARAQGAQLGPAPLQSPLREGLGVGPLQPAVVFDVVQVPTLSPTGLDGPLGPFSENLAQLRPRELERAALAHPGRDPGEEGLDQPLHPPAQLVGLQVGDQQPAAAVDVVAHPAGGDDPLLEIKGGHSADGKAVAPVHVRHGQGLPHQAGQKGHVGQLFEGVSRLSLGVEAGAEKGQGRGPRRPGLLEPESKLIDPLHSQLDLVLGDGQGRTRSKAPPAFLSFFTHPE